MSFNKILFISVTKTGSSSIRVWFKNHIPDKYIPVVILPSWEWKKIPGFIFIDFDWGHHVNIYATNLKYKTIENYWKDLEFTCVRNPLDRLVSGYFYNQQINAKEKQLYKYSFKKLIMRRKEIQKNMSINAFNHIYRLQTEFPIQNCKVFLHTESLSNDWENFCKLIGVEYHPIGNEMTSTHNHFMEYWDDEMLEFSYEYLKPDFDFLGYKYPGK